jgi:acyl carrier protein
MDRSAVTALILETLDDFVVSDSAKSIQHTEETVLFGADGLMDSIALVSFILDVEDGLRSRFGVSITLADARAMSQSRSPFRKVSFLVDYAMQLVEEQSGKKT